MLRVAGGASSQDWPVVRAATVAPRTANGRSSTATATSWRPAVRPAPAAVGTEDSLAQAGRPPCPPRIRAPAMTLSPSGGLMGDAVASKDPARWPESSSLIGGPEMPEDRIGTREEWQAARLELGELEAEQAELDEEIKRKRRELPWVPVEKEYVFDTEDGKKQLAELFEGRSQLLAYNIMFGPDFETGACPGCTNLADGVEGLLLHMNKRDVTLICFSRAPIDRLGAYKQRMGWQFPYVSTYGTDFPFDFGLALTQEQARQIRELQEMAQNPPGWLEFWASQVGP